MSSLAARSLGIPVALMEPMVKLPHRGDVRWLDEHGAGAIEYPQEPPRRQGWCNGIDVETAATVRCGDEDPESKARRGCRYFGDMHQAQ